MWRTSFVIALATSLFLAACGGSTNYSSTVSNSVPMAPNSVPMTMTIGDAPPSGIAVLFLEALITGATLQPSDPSKPAVKVLSTPVEVEFTHLQTDTALLSLANVPPDTYKSITLSFDNVTLTIENHSGAAFGSCMDNSVCELTPTVTPSSVTLSSAPFPITITPNSVVALRFDLDVNSSILSGLSSINPTITITNVIQRDESQGSKEVGEVDEVDGQVTNMMGNNQFTLMNEQSGQSFNITVGTNTVFQDFNRAGCTVIPADFTCVKMGQILDVDLSATGMGMTLAKRVEFEEDASHQALKGVITSVDCGKPQFQMVVFNEEPTMAGISEGSPIVVMIPNAVFQAAQEEMGEDGGFSSSNLSFAGCKDLLVGQDVQIRPGTASTSGGITRVTTDLVRLWPSQITGTVGSVDTSNGTFTLTGFSPLFTFAMPAAVTTITVETVSGMLVLDGSGSGLPTVGTVSVKGLLFNTFSTLGMPTLVTRTMREHHDD